MWIDWSNDKGHAYRNMHMHCFINLKNIADFVCAVNCLFVSFESMRLMHQADFYIKNWGLPPVSG